MNWSRILVLTYKPATASQWDEDLNSHVDFEGWTFAKSSQKDPAEFLKASKLVYFASFQDILGKTNKKQLVKEKFKDVLMLDWDAAFIAEYHFGAWRDAAKGLYASEDEPVGKYS